MGRQRLTLAQFPLMLPLAGVIGGILLSVAGCWIWWGAAALILVATASMWGAQRIRILLSGVAACFGALLFYLTSPAEVSYGVNHMSGVVTSAGPSSGSQRIVVRTPCGANIGVTLYAYPEVVEPGDSVSFTALLLPSVKATTVPGKRTDRGYALSERLSAGCEVSEENFHIDSYASGVRGQLNDLRYRLKELIKHSGLSQGAATFMTAILLGENEMPRQTRQEFARAGISHVLALSGLHVATIVMLISMLLIPVEMAGGSRMRILLLLALLWFYALLTGMMPSVVRAVIMASFMMGGRLLERDSNTLNSLFGAGLFILLFSPGSLFSISFQLSFVATAGIVLFIPLSDGLMSYLGHGRRSRIIMKLFLLVGVPVVAVLFTSPLTIWYFHTFPLWFLVANLPMAFLMPVLLCVGVLMLPYVALTGGGGFAADIINGIYRLVEWIAETVASLPGEMSQGGFYYSGFVIPLFYLGYVILAVGLNRIGDRDYDRKIKGKLLLIQGVIVVVSTVFIAWLSVPSFPENEEYVWRTKRGIAIVERRGESVNLITDANPKYYEEIRRNAEYMLTDFLMSRNAMIAEIGDRDTALWVVGDYHCVIVRSEEDLSVIESAKQRYGDPAVIVSRGFKGDIAEVAEAAEGCTIVLSPSLSLKRRSRYAETLAATGYPFAYNIYSPSTK